MHFNLLRRRRRKVLGTMMWTKTKSQSPPPPSFQKTLKNQTKIPHTKTHPIPFHSRLDSLPIPSSPFALLLPAPPQAGHYRSPRPLPRGDGLPVAQSHCAGVSRPSPNSQSDPHALAGRGNSGSAKKITGWTPQSYRGKRSICATAGGQPAGVQPWWLHPSVVQVKIDPCRGACGRACPAPMP